MRAVKAKQLRKESGFVPSEDRNYTKQKRSRGQVQLVAVGARRNYQDSK